MKLESTLDWLFPRTMERIRLAAWNVGWQAAVEAFPPVRGGLAAIAAERLRQIEVEGFGAEHDARNDRGELAVAAACYAAPQDIYVLRTGVECLSFKSPWPWFGRNKRKKHCRRRQLEIAGALVAAEIDRLDTLERELQPAAGH